MVGTAWLTAWQTLDWHTPWLWPQRTQHAALVVAACAGLLLGSPVWLAQYQAWQAALAAQDKLQAQQLAAQQLRQQTQQIEHSLSASEFTLVDAQQLSALAPPAQLHLSQIGIAQTAPVSAAPAMQLSHMPIEVQFQGTWAGVQQWLAQWPQAAPGVTLASLALKAQPQGGIQGQLVALAPQIDGPTNSASPLVGQAAQVAQAKSSVTSDPFDALQWADTQREHAKRHPSYAQRVMPELRRPREPLEAYALDQLHYIGQIANGSRRDALVRVVEPRMQPHSGVSTPVHRVRVGEHLGPNFGRIQTIAADHVVIQELVLEPRGEWVYRAAQLALKEGSQ